MAENNRFSSIEPQARPLPENLKAAISRLNRFETLEIAGVHLSGQAKLSSIDRLLCPSCGQANEKGRDLCWACYKPLSVPSNPTPEPDQEVCVVLDGVSYRSSDADLPPDIRELIGRIRKEGYSAALMKEWQRSSATRYPAKGTPAHPAPVAALDKDRVQAFQGQRVSVLRIDGVLYKSDDPDLPPEITEIFGYIEAEGLTPALMQHLRLYGTKVKYRPISIPQPSDGDLNFWDAAKKVFEG